MNKRRLILAGAFTLTLTSIAYVAMRAPSIDVVAPQLGPVVQSVVASGQVMPPAEIKVGALVTSTAQEVRFREGDLVKAGQVLVQLDAGEAQMSVKQAEALLASARAGRSELNQLNAPAAEAQLRQAEASYAQAKDQASREKTLFESGATTQVSLQEYQTALAVAEAQKEAAALQFKAASKGGTRSATLAASVAQAEAELARARVVLARHTIVAPADGVLLSRNVEPGDAVLSGSTLFVLSAQGATRLKIEPDERNLALLHVGQPARAATEAFPLDSFAASLQYIAPAVDPQRGTVEVRLLVPEPPAFLRPHMTVSVEVEVARDEKALLIPRSTLVDEARAPYVLVVEYDALVKRPVKLGVVGDTFVGIVSGLDSKALIVTKPEQSRGAGNHVRPHLVSALAQEQ